MEQQDERRRTGAGEVGGEMEHRGAAGIADAQLHRLADGTERAALGGRGGRAEGGQGGHD